MSKYAKYFDMRKDGSAKCRLNCDYVTPPSKSKPTNCLKFHLRGHHPEQFKEFEIVQLPPSMHELFREWLLFEAEKIALGDIKIV
jgi:hypothetical protein